ncbi:unnamed protein product [Alopecurus aequalis]
MRLNKGGGGVSWCHPRLTQRQHPAIVAKVCCHESMLAGQHRLKRVGIQKLNQPGGLSSTMNRLPDEAIELTAAAHIERELQITSWKLRRNFVACTNQEMIVASSKFSTTIRWW